MHNKFDENRVLDFIAFAWLTNTNFDSETITFNKLCIWLVVLTFEIDSLTYIYSVVSPASEWVTVMATKQMPLFGFRHSTNGFAVVHLPSDDAFRCVRWRENASKFRRIIVRIYAMSWPQSPLSIYRFWMVLSADLLGCVTPSDAYKIELR